MADENSDRGPMNSRSSPCKRLSIFLFLLLGCAVLLGGRAAAQQATAQVTGKVTDSTGAIIVGAEVALRNSETGVSRKTTSNKDGEYLFALIPIGSYEILVKQKNFQTYD